MWMFLLQLRWSIKGLIATDHDVSGYRWYIQSPLKIMKSIQVLLVFDESNFHSESRWELIRTRHILRATTSTPWATWPRWHRFNVTKHSLAFPAQKHQNYQTTHNDSVSDTWILRLVDSAMQLTSFIATQPPLTEQPSHQAVNAHTARAPAQTATYTNYYKEQSATIL